jgi:hypothetical protein
MSVTRFGASRAICRRMKSGFSALRLKPTGEIEHGREEKTDRSTPAVTFPQWWAR